MYEPAVALTDYGLCVLCAVFAYFLRRGDLPESPLRLLWPVFFIALSFSSFLGGTVHGFFLVHEGFSYQILWTLTMLSIGIAASCIWIHSLLMLFGLQSLQRVMVFASISYFCYGYAVLFYTQDYSVVIANYAPALVVLAIASTMQMLKTRESRYLMLLFAVFLSFTAAIAQHMRFSLLAVYFDHNSTYHLIQAFGLVAFFKGASGGDFPGNQAPS